MQLFLAFAALESLVLYEVPKLGVGFCDESERLYRCQFDDFVLTCFQKVFFQQIVGKSLFLQFLIMSDGTDPAIQSFLIVLIRYLPVKFLYNRDYKLILLILWLHKAV